MIARVLVILVLLAIAAFCIFGFMATFEPPGFMVMRIAYGAGGLLCLGGAGWVLFGKSRSA